MSKLHNSGAVPSTDLPNQLPNGTTTISSLLGTANYELTKQLMGRLLTLMDASLPEGKQTEALKDLIRQELYQADTNLWKEMNQFNRENKIVPNTNAAGWSPIQ